MSTPEAIIVRENDFVFISYSHINSDFVQQLCHLLDANDVSYWIDKTGIPPSADWWQEITTNIDKASAFLFVMTPDALGSPVCNLELAYAHTGQKRIIPLWNSSRDPFNEGRIKFGEKIELIDDYVKSLYEKRDSKDDIFKSNEQLLRRPNWISVPDDAALKASLPKIIEAITKDLNYLSEHTRLLVRAREWEHSDKNNTSLLLRGTALQDALSWLNSIAADNEDSPPSALHREYIETSRLFEQRAQRIRFSFVSIASAILLVLFIVALVARQNEAIAKDEAIQERNEQQRIAQTFALVDNTYKQPVGMGPNDPILLNLDLWVSHRDDGTLWRLAADTGEPTGEPITVGTRPDAPITDGEYVWVASRSDHLITRVDPEMDQTPLSITLEIEPEWLMVAGDWLWVVGSSHQVYTAVQIERTSGAIADPITIGRRVAGVNFDGTYLWIQVDNPGTASLFRIHHTSRETGRLDLENVPQKPIVVDNMLWLTMERSGILNKIQPNTLQIVEVFEIGERLATPVYDGHWLWLNDFEAKSVIQFNPETGKIVRELPISTSRPVFREGRNLWAFTSDGFLTAYDVGTRKFWSKTPLLGTYTNPITDGENMWLSHQQQDIIAMIRLADGVLLRTLPNCARPGNPLFDGANVWVACREENTIARIPALMGYYGVNPFTANVEPYTPVYTRIADQEYLWIVQQATGTMVQFDAVDGQVLNTLSVGTRPLPPVFDDPYIWIAASQGRQITRVDTRDIRQTRTLQVEIGEIAYVERAGDHIWVSGYSSNPFAIDDPDLLMIDRDNLNILQEYELGIGASRAVYDEGIIWVTGTSLEAGTVYRLNASNGEPLSTSPVGLVSYEPVIDGEYAWVSSLYPEDASNLLSDLLSANTGTLYQLERSTGNVINKIDLDELPSLPIIGGDYIWITQGSFELETSAAARMLGAEAEVENTRGVVAIHPEKGEIVKTWSPCRNVGTPFYDGKFIWGICLGYEDSRLDDSGTVVVIDAQTLEVVQQYEGLGRFPWPAHRFGDYVWIIYQGTANALVFRADDGALIRRIGLIEGPTFPVFDNQQYLWLSNTAANAVQRFRLES